MFKNIDKKSLFKATAYHLIGLFILGISSFALVYFLQACIQSNGFDFELARQYFLSHPFSLAINSLFVFLIGFALSLISGSLFIGSGLNSILFIGFGYANLLKMQSRSEPIFPTELAMAKNLPELLSMVDGKKVIGILLGFALALTIIICIHILIKRLLHLKRQSYKSYIFRGLLLIPTIFFLSQFYFIGSKQTVVKSALDSHNLKNLSFNQTQNYQTNGTMIGFLMNATTPKSPEPKNYSEATVKEIIHRYQKLAKENNSGKSSLPKRINFNLILSESLTDVNYPDIKSYINLNVNPLSFMSSLKDKSNAVVGTMISDQYGGGTANVEYEVITGMSNYFLSTTTSPYQSLVPKEKEYPSFAYDFKSNGLDTKALHPYKASMYKRGDNYPKLGIDKFITEEQMKKLALNPYGAYTTDKSLFKLLYQEWTKSSNQKGQFNFTLTMQNHLPYRDSWDGSMLEKAKIKPIQATYTQQTLKDKVPNLDINPVNNYVNSLKLTDDAIEALYNKVQKQKEPTLVALFGDHRPGGIFDYLATKDPIMAHTTPVLYFANFDLKQLDLKEFSPSAVIPNAFQVANFKTTAWQQLIIELQKEVPVLTTIGSIDNQGKKISKTQLEKNQAYRDYEIINYDQNFGKKYAQQLGFFK